MAAEGREDSLAVAAVAMAPAGSKAGGDGTKIFASNQTLTSCRIISARKTNRRRELSPLSANIRYSCTYPDHCLCV
jgi:hypothetical protein